MHRLRSSTSRSRPASNTIGCTRERSGRTSLATSHGPTQSSSGRNSISRETRSRSIAPGLSAGSSARPLGKTSLFRDPRSPRRARVAVRTERTRSSQATGAATPARGSVSSEAATRPATGLAAARRGQASVATDWRDVRPGPRRVYGTSFGCNASRWPPAVELGVTLPRAPITSSCGRFGPRLPRRSNRQLQAGWPLPPMPPGWSGGTGEGGCRELRVRSPPLVPADCRRRLPGPGCLGVAVARVWLVDSSSSIFREQLHGDRLGLDAALVSLHVHVRAAWVDESRFLRCRRGRCKWGRCRCSS